MASTSLLKRFDHDRCAAVDARGRGRRFRFRASRTTAKAGGVPDMPPLSLGGAVMPRAEH